MCLLPVGSGMPWMGVAVYVAGWQWAGWRLLVLECWFVCALSVNGSGRLGFVLCEGREVVRVCVCSL